MALSDQMYREQNGIPHPATLGEVPKPTTRPFELSDQIDHAPVGESTARVAVEDAFRNFKGDDPEERIR